MGRLLVCGNLNIDRILEVEFLPKEGQSAPVRSQRIVHGGCGGNIAVAARKLGMEVFLSSAVGMDFESSYLTMLRDHDIDLSELKYDEALPSPCCTVLSAPDGQQAYAFMMGSMENQLDLCHPTMEGMDFTHIATSDPAFCIRISRESTSAGIPVGFDPGQEIYFRWKGKEVGEVLENSNWFFGNMGEWEYLLDILDLDWHEKSVGKVIYPFTEELFDMVDEAIVTLGKKGSLLIDGDGARHQRQIEVGPYVEHTGAGDAFRGAFYAAKMHGIDTFESLRIGNAMGALSISSDSPQGYEIDWAGLMELLE